MEFDNRPAPSPAGALVPPPHKPPVALAAASPSPRPRWREDWRPVVPPLNAGFISLALDFLDNLGDVIRAAAIR